MKQNCSQKIVKPICMVGPSTQGHELCVSILKAKIQEKKINKMEMTLACMDFCVHMFIF